MLNLICAECGISFIREKNSNKPPKTTYCSVKCRNNSLRHPPHNLTCVGCGISFTRKYIDKRSKNTYCNVGCRDKSREGKVFATRKKSATPTSRYKMPEDDILKLESPTHNLIVFHGQVSSAQQVRDVDLFDVAIEFMEKETFNKCTIAYGQIGSPVMEVKTFYRKILAVEETP